ncbi:MAG: 3-oxoacyl-ACP synthase, partial [Lachnospiraceae bacterium]|nr:3-oxoacyl-ACP synthase [Lachnospiraceae bacterium]
MTGVIAGTGSYVPSYVMDNNKLSEFVDTSDEWIKERTGVARRHIVADETTSFMAAEAAKKAVED